MVVFSYVYAILPKSFETNSAQGCLIYSSSSSSRIERTFFTGTLDLTRSLGSDEKGAICNMRNLMWLMCRLRTAVLVRRKKLANAGLTRNDNAAEAQTLDI